MICFNPTAPWLPSDQFSSIPTFSWKWLHVTGKHIFTFLLKDIHLTINQSVIVSAYYVIDKKIVNMHPDLSYLF